MVSFIILMLTFILHIHYTGNNACTSLTAMIAMHMQLNAGLIQFAVGRLECRLNYTATHDIYIADMSSILYI